MQRIAIFAALQWECRAVVHQLRQVERGRRGDFVCWRGRAAQREVWVVKTGVGVLRAAAAATAVGDPRAFELLMSTGCAGGLAPELQPGDLAVATLLIGDGTHRPLPTDAAQRARAREVAAASDVRGMEGPILCSATALMTASEKRKAAADGAIAVEMEGGPIAARAAGAGVPFLSVRAVLDTADADLPIPAALIDGASGGVRPLALAAHLVAHPGDSTELMALRRMQSAARESLERFFGRWLAAPV
jgi:nucleoside phosphorylase